MAYVEQRVEAAAPQTASVPASLLPKQYVMPFILVTALFFSWALAAQLNDVLIRQFQKALDRFGAFVESWRSAGTTRNAVAADPGVLPGVLAGVLSHS